MSNKKQLIKGSFFALTILLGVPLYSVLAQNGGEIPGTSLDTKSTPHVAGATEEKEFVRVKLPAWLVKQPAKAKLRAFDPEQLTANSPVKLTITFQDPKKTTYLPGEAIPIVLEIKNSGAKEENYHESSPGLNYRFDVLDEFGFSMPTTMFANDDSSATLYQNDLTLEPGGKRVVNLTVNQYVDLTIPKRYKIVVQKSFASGIVASNPLIASVQAASDVTPQGVDMTKRDAEIQEELKQGDD